MLIHAETRYVLLPVADLNWKGKTCLNVVFIS